MVNEGAVDEIGGAPGKQCGEGTEEPREDLTFRFAKRSEEPWNQSLSPQVQATRNFLWRVW